MAHPKGVLIERLQKEGRQPRFESRMSGPDHEPVFDAEVVVDDEVLGRGTGPNKRTAEREAAEQALAALDGSGGSRGKKGGRGKRRSSSGGSSKSGGSSAGSSSGSGTSSRKKSSGGKNTSAPAEEAPAAPAADEPFEGPWPVFETVLATSLRIAHDRIAAGLASDDARERIEAFALNLYKNVLQDLGEIVEEEIEDDAGANG